MLLRRRLCSSPHSIVRACALCLLPAMLATALLAPQTCSAFSYQGHNIIEAHAYLRLLHNESVFLERYPGVTGKHILDTLISIGVLTAPDCWVLNNDCRLNPDDPLRWYPTIRSGEQDFMLAQQFSSKSQAFHFMARSHDTYRHDSVLAGHDAPVDLLDSAYPRCMRYLTTVFRQLVAADRTCCVETHDIYVLMHSIADSYSGGHVERDSVTGEIQHLKPWQARAWVSYLIFWSGWKYFFSNTHHSFGTEMRDEAYIDCPDGPTMAPYAVPWSCLSARGREASYALEDLIVSTYAVMRDSSTRDSEWTAYCMRHLKAMNPALMTAEMFEPRIEDAEFEAHTTVGAQYRRNSTRASNDVFATATIESSQIGPLTIGVGGSAGVRIDTGGTSPFFGLDLFSWSMPLTDEVALGMSPLMIDFAGDGADAKRNLYASFFRLDLYPWRGMWFRFEGPRFSYLDNSFVPELSFAVGRAFELTSTDLFSTMIRSALKKESLREPRGDKWMLPDTITNERIGPLFTGMISPVGIGFHRNGASLNASFEIVFDRNSTGMRTGAGIGAYVRAGVGRMHATEDGGVMFGMISFGPELRFKTPILPIPLLVQPFDVAFIAGQPENQGYELSAMLGLPIDLGSVEIAFELGRWSWRERRFDHVHFPAGLRIGLSYHESHFLRLAGY